MSDKLQQAVSTLLTPAEINGNQLDSVLGSMLRFSVDDADIYFQSTYSESWTLEDGRVKDGAFDISRGVGVRAICGSKTGFAYADEIALPTLAKTAEAARSIARLGQSNEIKIAKQAAAPELYQATNPLTSIAELEKISLLKRVDEIARGADPRVEQVIASLSATYDTVLIMGADGTMAADIRPLVRISVHVIVHQNARREQGSSGGGGRFTYQEIMSKNLAEYHAKEAVRQALLNLEAVSAPAGTMPVILGPGWPGVLLHEAVGHGLEGDFNRKGSSAFTGRIGEQVASPLCTIVDDGTLPGRRGSLNIDDEGTPSQYTTLIENGVLRNYMQDKLNARLMKMQPTGNGRRESYASQPMPRMTNTYMLAGPHDPEEIIKSVEKGLYAVNFAGGQVDITSGKFVFSTSEAYLIEKGKITTPVKGATLIGSGPEAMTKISMVGNDLQLDQGVGTCGKDGQTVPVGVGQPTLKVDELTVGGTR